MKVRKIIHDASRTGSFIIPKTHKIDICFLSSFFYFLDILRSSRKCLKYLCRNFLCISCSAGIYHLIFQHCILLSIDVFPLVSFYWCDIY